MSLSHLLNLRITRTGTKAALIVDKDQGRRVVLEADDDGGDKQAAAQLGPRGSVSSRVCIL